MIRPERVCAAIGIVVCTSVVWAAPSLVMVPPIADQTSSEVRAITPDGRYAVGKSGTTGFLWDSLTAPANSVVVISGAAMKEATGVAYRTYDSVQEVAVFGRIDYGLGNNTPCIGITSNGGASWSKAWRDGANFANSLLGAANTLAGPGDTDLLWASFGKSGQYYISIAKLTGASTGLTVASDNKATDSGSELTVNGVSKGGLAVGSRMVSGVKSNYYNSWVGNGTGSVAFFKGLDETNAGEAFCVAGDKASGKIFGRSPKAGDARLFPYMHDLATGQTLQLPMFGDEDGSTSLSVPYGCSEDGRYVSGMLYRGMEKAVLWDTQVGTVVDLTQYFQDAGLLGNFTRLSRAYSVAVDSSGIVWVAGSGPWTEDGATFVTRGWLASVSAEPVGACLEVGYGFRRCRVTTEEECTAEDPAHTLTWTLGEGCVNKACAAPFADADSDGDVDQIDFGFFQACFDPTAIRPGCDCMNPNGDSKVDSSDLNAFVACYSGPAVAANPDCD
ncbi:MAG TPA: hypothetical protein PKY77_00460 [Phycisphaerae bacterium]|nr:hypothetical protein [Phycisphaerae bacterium]HRY67675.1 hypothetical protein [Phycisphaerae bacterium]HSA25062.1 hypothetical protein [Phycisphaerae bacterium]